MKKTKFFLDLLKGVAVAVGITLIGIAAMALFAKNTESDFLSIISIVIKIISIVVGTVVFGRKIRKRGAVLGIIIAFVYWLACLVLSLIAEPIQFSFSMLADLLFSLLIGAFAGILTVNALK